MPKTRRKPRRRAQSLPQLPAWPQLPVWPWEPIEPVAFPCLPLQPGNRVEHTQSGLLGIVVAVRTGAVDWEPFGGQPETTEPDLLKRYFN